MSGYVQDGIDELRLKKIAKKYMKTWFLLDLLLLTFDVITLLLLTHGTLTLFNYKDRRLHGWHGPSATFRQDQILYALRCFLVCRFFKVNSKMERRFGWRIQSVPHRIKLGVVNLAWLILLCCHISACGFYAVGTIYDGQEGSWVEANLEGKTIGVKYMLSLQWALAQFSLGTTDVHAGSFAEASYAAGVTLIAAFLMLLLFGRLVTAVIQLGSTPQGKREQEMASLMEYLHQCRAPASLRSRIWVTVAERSAVADTSGQRIHEDDVSILLACLPRALQDELRISVYAPVFSVHPFFSELELGSGAGREAVKLHGAISEVELQAEQVLFSADWVAKSMYFVVLGDLRYCTMALGADAEKEKKVGPWFCEPALWIQWKHRGEVTAVTHTELFALDAQRFQTIMKQAFPQVAWCWRYARGFQKYADANLNDIDIDTGALNKLVASALAEDESTGLGTSVNAESRRGAMDGDVFRSGSDGPSSHTGASLERVTLPQELPGLIEEA
jgi:hypothetical protein